MLFIFTFSSLEHYFRRNIILPLEPQADCLSPQISSTRAAPCLAGVCTGMAKELTALVGKQISVITNDGRNIIGILRGFDQTTNLILEECFERVYSASQAGWSKLCSGCTSSGGTTSRSSASWTRSWTKSWTCRIYEPHR